MAADERRRLNSANARKGWNISADARRERTRPMREGFVRKLEAETVAEFPEIAGNTAEIGRVVDGKLREHYARMRASSLKTRREKAAGQQAAGGALALFHLDGRQLAPRSRVTYPPNFGDWHAVRPPVTPVLLSQIKPPLSPGAPGTGQRPRLSPA